MKSGRLQLTVALVLGLLAAGPLGADAQRAQGPKAATVGFLFGGTRPGDSLDRFKQTLREKGWIEGQNLMFEYRSAEAHYERLPALSRELVARGVDVIVTDGTPQTRAAMDVTKTVPIVMASAGDPVASALVRSLARPGGNVTGVSFFFPEINVKRLELLKEAAPSIARVAVVYNPLNPAVEPAVVAIEAAAKPLRIGIQRFAVRAPADLDAVFPVMANQKVDAITVVEDSMIYSQGLRIVEVALKARIPVVFGSSGFVAAGGFMSYGTNRPGLWHRAALLTDKILRGAKPGDLPIEQPTKFDLVINLKTAKALGLTIPPSLLLQADQVIE